MGDDFNPAMEYEQRGYLNCDFRLFHLDEAKPLDTPWHYHDFDKIVFFLRGNASYAVEGRSYDLKPYDLVLVPHHNIHKAAARADEQYERYVLYVRPETIAELGRGTQDNPLEACFNLAIENHVNLVHFDAGITADILSAFQKLENDLINEDSLYASDLQIRADLICLLIKLNESCVRCPDAFLEKARYNRKVVDIIDFIQENLSSDLSIDQIADRFYISKYHMMRIFKSETGYSVHQYIMEKRILKARDLIIGGESAMSASIDSGFHDYSSFCKAFQKQTGKLPSEYGHVE